MRFRSLPTPFALGLLAVSTLLAAPASARAQENQELGRMWTFERPPLDYLEAEYGFRPTQEWLDFVRMASLRFGSGCSASFVSPRGLILTNHHCVRGNIAENQGDEDWVSTGYVASGGLDDEVRLEGLTVQQLVEMREVTDEIQEGITEADDPDAAATKRQANREAVLARMQEQHPDLDHQIVDLFQGAIRMVYSYKIYDDVRLVVAPHLQAAHFGGDFDNFTYPRYCTDFALCRAYEDGEPADTSRFFFRWRQGGAKENELVFITGNPGTTKRLLTKAQFEQQRDGYFPWVRELIDNRLAIMRSFAERGDEIEKQLRTQILSYENAQKAFRGQHEGLLDPDFMAIKERAESQFRQRVAGDSELAERYGDLWERIAENAGRRTELEFPLRFHVEGGSQPLRRAVLAVEAARAEGEQREELMAQLATIPDEGGPLQTAYFIDHIERARGKLPEDDPFLTALLADGRLTPAQASARLDGSAIGDPAFVEELVAGGADAVASSDDFAVAVARVLAPLKERNRKLAETLEAEQEELGVQLGRALFAAYGTDVSPDATFTLRFSDGRVRGYTYNGTKAPWHTTFYGMFARAQEFGFEYPWDLPQAWREAKDRIDMTTPLNFVATNDSTGGNSGSPMIDAQGRIVGLLFDGNIESLPNDFIFRDVVQRSVMVHVDGILESLFEVYGADRVAAELLAGSLEASPIADEAMAGAAGGDDD